MARCALDCFGFLQWFSVVSLVASVVMIVIWGVFFVLWWRLRRDGRRTLANAQHAVARAQELHDFGVAALEEAEGVRQELRLLWGERPPVAH